MHIKQIIIQGFKSYKNQTIVEPFSPKHNVVVGRNGSGKSNFFAAIRFVLSDDYTQMGREERQALLHEGSGSAVMSAYVEIIFDNADNRFQTGKDELVIRRTIGLKKDEYSLDRKNASKTDVMNLLESAGFSRANPYYIVPQGRVTRLTNMKDSERLEVLKDVAGCKMYENKKTESEKIMNETNNKLAAIDSAFDQINERLAELEEEQQEFRSFQEKDQEKRGLDYILLQREQDEINKNLVEIDDKRTTGIDDADEHRDRLAQCDAELIKINQAIAELRQQMDFARVDKKQLDDERRDGAKARAQVELAVKNLSDGQTMSQRAKQQHDAEMRRLRGEIAQKEQELGTVLPKYHDLKAQELAARTQLGEAESTRQQLYQKQGRNARFKNKKERDDWLQGQIDDTFSRLSTMKAVRMQNQEDARDLQNDIARLEPEVEQLQQQLAGRGTAMAELEQELQAAKERRDHLMDQRKELWREESKLDSTLATTNDNLRRAETTLSHMMDGKISQGIASVRRIAAQHNIPGCYGTLAELIEVETHRTAVEVIAGNSLFHYVVDSDATSTKLIEMLNKERAGRVTFMPLNKLKPKHSKFPNAQDARPLMSLIKYDPKFERAVQHVFGNAIICQNLIVAAQYARTHGVNAVTPEGDRSDKRGALTGGWHDPRRSRLTATRDLMACREEYDAKRVRSGELKKQLEKIDQTITKAEGEVQKLEQRKNQAVNQHGPLRQELRSKLDMLENKRKSLEEQQDQEANNASNVKALNDIQAAHEAELGSEFKQALTPAEETRLDSLSTAIPGLQRKYNDLASKRADLESQKSILESELNAKLRPLLEQLEASEFENMEADSNSNLQDQQRELNRLTEHLDSIQQRITEIEDQLDICAAGIATYEAQAAETRREQDELTKLIERHQRRLEKSMQKRAVLQARKQECIDSIRELGALTDEVKVKYRHLDSNAVIKRKHKVEEALKKFTSVNKHAFEHYRKSVKQREALDERRKELEASKAKIEELIEVLDQRKDEAIERTFKQVSKEFATVFSKLVPAGRGRLIIQRKTDTRAQDGDDEASDPEPGQKGAVENYTGVGISVSFNSKHDDQQRIQQLSGGQKSLCALTLIFAIQATDPGPFYLFDEIDANLDAQYRTAVAEHLQRLSNGRQGDEESGGQFICTTFRPEMLRVAKKCYGVTFANNVSSIRAVPMEEALEFVEGQAKGN